MTMSFKNKIIKSIITRVVFGANFPLKKQNWYKINIPIKNNKKPVKRFAI